MAVSGVYLNVVMNFDEGINILNKDSLATKDCLTTVKQVFFSLSPEGSLVDIWAY